MYQINSYTDAVIKKLHMNDFPLVFLSRGTRM